MKFSTPIAIGLVGITGAALAQVVNPPPRAGNNQVQSAANDTRPDALANSSAVPTEDRLGNQADNGVMRNETTPPLDARSPEAERLSRGGTLDSEAARGTGAWSGTGAASSASGTSSAGGSSPR
ncbi:MAG: hypothetical protein A4S12_06595 [Proteobacteria bacterium SG_bin5]|nr:hypothetical protein [Sphingomonas sp.]OQW42654.1 MAG: hypothetical protein A4S12_06595 [Proteobacteria bacterium SG_bin5]